MPYPTLHNVLVPTSDTDYINSGIYLSVGDYIECKAYILSNFVSDAHAARTIFGVRTQGTYRDGYQLMFVCQGTTHYKRINIVYGNSSTYTSLSDALYYESYQSETYIAGRNTEVGYLCGHPEYPFRRLTVYNDTVQQYSRFSTQVQNNHLFDSVTTLSYPVYLFALNNMSSVVNYGKSDIGIEYFNICSGGSTGSLIHNLIPYLQSGKCGMLDTITNQFHGFVNGSTGQIIQKI